MRVATWNVNSLRARLARVEEWISYANPDVVCMQETKLADDAFPHAAFATLGYEVAAHGTGQWNGVAIASRVGLDNVSVGFEGATDQMTEPRLIAADCGGVRIFSVYVPNGRALDDPHYEFKLRWLDTLADLLHSEYSPLDALAICGDFNIAPEDIDVWDTKHFAGATHVSDAERKSLAQLCDWGLVDTFRRLHPEKGLFSWWDYRGGDFHKGHGMRIDLLLMTATLNDNATFGLVDRQARKGEKPSDHAPVFIDVQSR